MAKIIQTTFQLRRGLSSDWHLVNPILAPGEPGFELDTGRLKVGNGVVHYNSLPYISGGSAATIKGVVSTVANLPSSDNTDGDMYVVEEDGHTYIWVSDQWNDAGPIIDLTGYATLSDLNYKVDKVTGKGLSTNDFTSELLTKLNGIEAGAQVNPDLSSYATLASPALTGTPTAPTAATGTDTTQIATTAFVQQELASFIPTDYMKKGVDYVTAGQDPDTTLGLNATAEGMYVTASGDFSHAEGSYTTASASNAHAEGNFSNASGGTSHAEGDYTVAGGSSAHSEGSSTQATGNYSHTEGRNTFAIGTASHTEGISTRAEGDYSHAQNKGTIAASNEQTALGRYNIADNNAVYAEIVGNGTKDSSRSNARTLDWSGNEVLAGKLTVGAGPTNAMDVATKQYVDNRIPSSNTYMVKGLDYVTAGKKNGTNLGTKATTEGYNTTASGDYSHAEGNGTVANMRTAHAEGTSTMAQGIGAHAEGSETAANGTASHAEGQSTIASGDFSHASGKGNKAYRQSQYVFGEFNIPETGTASSRGTYVEIVGNGATASNTSNARTLDWSGNQWLSGNLKIGGTSYSDVNAKEVATKEYVDANADVVTITITNQSIAANVYTEIDTAYAASKGVILFVPNASHRVSNVGEIFTLVEKYEWTEEDQSGISYIFKSILEDTQVAGYVVTYISSSNQYVMDYDTTVTLATLDSPAFTGYPTAPDITINSSATQIANKGYVDVKADIASPTFTGIPAAPTAATGTDTTQIATTAFVQQEITANAPSLGNYMVKGTDYVTAGQYEGVTLGTQATAEGYRSQATGNYSHVEGSGSTASGIAAHAEGGATTASGNYSHTEGNATEATGDTAHAEGGATHATGASAHAEGSATTASGKYSHAGGRKTIAAGAAQIAVGTFNIADTLGQSSYWPDVYKPDYGNYVEIVGNGITNDTRSNARTLDWFGNQWLAGTLKVGGTNYDDSNAQEVATKAYVNAQSTSALVTTAATTTTNITIAPNTTVNITGSSAITSLNVTLGVPVDGYATQYTLIFTAGSNLSCTFTATSGYAIKDMNSITFTSGKVQYLNFVVLHGQVNGSNETIIGVRHEEY